MLAEIAAKVLMFLGTKKGCSAVAVIDVFFDASEMNGYTSVAGLIFRKKHLRTFERGWSAMLRKYGLSHFHMTDCNAAQGEFRGWCREKRDACAREAIDLLVSYPLKGIAFTIKNQDFDEVITSEGLMPNAVTLGVWASLFAVRSWADNSDSEARISYFFESGDEEQRSVNNLLNSIAEDPVRRSNARYRRHAFVSKISSFAAQASDILAWHAAKYAPRRETGERMRGDFNAIVTKLSVSDDYHDRNWLMQLLEISRKHAGEDGNRLAQTAFLYNRSNARQMERKFLEIWTEAR
ncbi:hypothetical protein [Parerythrobacter lacustris]|uniref:DUF3800 domain-containing protein n=1 Tax=Parerythrobacter lacustris TaxID=2969984 RepID=A0ABT1XRD1_9SPHN|nr:hypothetical protein [Parerythrobacter lacustris]MCR2833491.1 hypothetical protein [Parerythrobacter lacustris]